MASLVVVLNEGSLKQALLTIDPGTSEDELAEAAQRLNRTCMELTAADLAERLRWFDEAPADDPVFTLVRRAGERALRILREFDAATVEQLFSDGLLHVMAEPEFAASEKLRRVFAVLENRTVPRRALRGRDALGRPAGLHRAGEPPGRDGRRGPRPRHRTAGPGAAVGVVGVLGPTRLRYAQAIGTVRFVAGLMNDLVDHLYAPDARTSRMPRPPRTAP